MKRNKRLLSCIFSGKDKHQEAEHHASETIPQDVSEQKEPSDRSSEKRSDFFYSGLNLLLKIGWIVLGLFIPPLS